VGSGYRKNVQQFNMFFYRIQNNIMAVVQNPHIAVHLVAVNNR